MTDQERVSRFRTERLGDAVEHLERLVGEDPELVLSLAQERLRVRVTDAMQQARQLQGLTQAGLAERMGITQGRVSRLESAHYDRRLDSLVAYLHAAGAELVMAFKAGDTLIQVARPAGPQVVASPNGADARDDVVVVDSR